MAWAGLAAVLIYMAGQWRDVAEFYKGRSAKYGTMSLVSVVVFVGILIAINYLSTRQNKRWDFTANQVYSLSDQTIKVLKELPEPVKFTVYDQPTRFDSFRNRLDEFQYHSSKVQTEYVDPDREPARAKAAQVAAYGTVVIEYKDRTERVTSTDEQALTNALIKVVTGAAKKVYFTQGHGEKNTAGTDRNSYATLAQGLTSDNFAFEQLVLLQQKTVPADATVVVIAGPTHRLLPARNGRAQGVCRARRQGVRAAGSQGQGHRPGPAAADAVPDGLGHQRRRRHRARRERHGPADRHQRRVGAGRAAAYPPHADHRRLQPAHRLPAGAIDDQPRRRIERPHRAADPDHEPAQLGRGRPVVARRREGGVRRRQGRQAGTDHARRRRICAGDRRAAAAGSGQQQPGGA